MVAEPLFYSLCFCLFLDITLGIYVIDNRAERTAIKYELSTRGELQKSMVFSNVADKFFVIENSTGMV